MQCKTRGLLASYQTPMRLRPTRVSVKEPLLNEKQNKKTAEKVYIRVQPRSEDPSSGSIRTVTLQPANQSFGVNSIRKTKQNKTKKQKQFHKCSAAFSPGAPTGQTFPLETPPKQTSQQKNSLRPSPGPRQPAGLAADWSVLLDQQPKMFNCGEMRHYQRFSH